MGSKQSKRPSKQADTPESFTTPLLQVVAHDLNELNQDNFDDDRRPGRKSVVAEVKG